MPIMGSTVEREDAREMDFVTPPSSAHPFAAFSCDCRTWPCTCPQAPERPVQAQRGGVVGMMLTMEWCGGAFECRASQPCELHAYVRSIREQRRGWVPDGRTTTQRFDAHDRVIVDPRPARPAVDIAAEMAALPHRLTRN